MWIVLIALRRPYTFVALGLLIVLLGVFVTVDGGSRLKVNPVVLGRDLGNVVEVVSGLDADDGVVVNPPDSAVTGVAVRVASAAPAAVK